VTIDDQNDAMPVLMLLHRYGVINRTAGKQYERQEDLIAELREVQEEIAHRLSRTGLD
jgi:hypothetical protein